MFYMVVLFACCATLVTGQMRPCLSVIGESNSGIITHPMVIEEAREKDISSFWLQDIPWPFVCVWIFKLELGERVEIVFEDVNVFGYLMLEQQYDFKIGSLPSHSYWVQSLALGPGTKRSRVIFDHTTVRMHTPRYAGSFFVTYKVSFCSTPRFGDNIRLRKCSDGMRKGSICTLECAENYAHVNPKKRLFRTLCKSDKSWSEIPYKCIGKEQLVEYCLFGEPNSSEKSKCTYNERELVDLFHHLEDENVIVSKVPDERAPYFGGADQGNNSLKFKCNEYCKRSSRTGKFIQLCQTSEDKVFCVYCRYTKKVCPLILDYKPEQT